MSAEVAGAGCFVEDGGGGGTGPLITLLDEGVGGILVNILSILVEKKEL